MQQIYRRTLTLKCVSIRLLRNFIEVTLRHGCSPVNLLQILRTPFPKNTSRGLLLSCNPFKHSHYLNIFRYDVAVFTARQWKAKHVKHLKEVSQTDQIPVFPLACVWISKYASVITGIALSALVRCLGAHQCQIS